MGLEGEGPAGELKPREPREPDDMPPPTLAKESVPRTEKEKSRKAAETNMIFNHLFFGIQPSPRVVA
jgi:hypothetical protein